MSNLNKLKNLCYKVNARYKLGLNDDDQVSAMFKFYKTIDDCIILIGYDTYEAISRADFLEKIKEAHKTEVINENTHFTIFYNFNQYKGYIKTSELKN
jgi:hypothetical protein